MISHVAIRRLPSDTKAATESPASWSPSTGSVRTGQPLTSPSPHLSELLEDLEGSSSAGSIAECFVQRVSPGEGSQSGMGLGKAGGVPGSWDLRSP